MQGLGEPGSETRNPKIAALLHDLKLAETKGSGIRVMRELMAERNLSPPLFQSDRTGNSFLAMLLFHHFLGQEDLDWLKSFEQHSLTEDEMKAMISAREVGAIDNSTYRDINRDSDTLSASKHLRKLCDFGLLEKKGQGPATYYVPTPKSLDNWPPARYAADTPPDFHDNAEAIDAKSTKLDTKSTKLDTKSTKLDTKSTKLGAKSTKLSPEESSPTPPPELQALIDSLGGRGSKESAHEAVVRLLAWRALSVKQLAILLTRTPSHVRQEYIRPLIAAGRIEPTNPDSPTDPTQMYRTTQRPSDPDT